MQTYILAVDNREITLESDDSTLVRTSVGVDRIEFRFYSSEWLESFDLSTAFYVGDVLEEVPIYPSAVVGADWLATATVVIPSTVLANSGNLGVTVHGVDADGNHIITAESFPLTVEHEGDGIGDPPQPNPQ